MAKEKVALTIWASTIIVWLPGLLGLNNWFWLVKVELKLGLSFGIGIGTTTF
jgi:hypothetical protein